MLVANPLCWFCRDAAYLMNLDSILLMYSILLKNSLLLFLLRLLLLFFVCFFFVCLFFCFFFAVTTTADTAFAVIANFTYRHVFVSAPIFSPEIEQGRIDSLELDEASGLAASRLHPGILYSHNDHGDRPRLFAINASTAEVVATLEIR
jgi:hypothetical protein